MLYVLPYGQMSLWGKINFCALHDNKILNIEQKNKQRNKGKQ